MSSSSNEACAYENNDPIHENIFFKVGDIFDNFEELYARIKEMELNDMHSMSIYDSKTVETAQRRCDRSLNPKI